MRFEPFLWKKLSSVVEATFKIESVPEDLDKGEGVSRDDGILQMIQD